MRTSLYSHLLKRLLASIQRAHQNQRAAAMTEFVIGLPIFILIFAGVMDLYHINHKALEVKAAAASETLADAISIQTTMSGNMDHMVPIASTITDLVQGNYSSFADAVVNGTSGAGIYADSGLKVGLADLILPINPQPKLTLEDIMGASNSYSYNLLNDMISFEKEAFTTPSFAGVTSGILSLTGARPAIAAGLRYGAARSEEHSRTHAGNFGTYDVSAKYSLPAPPMPTHRALSVAMTRLEFARSKPFDKTIVVFDYSADTSGADESIREASNCAQGAELYQSCVNNNPQCQNNAPGPLCPCDIEDYDISEDCGSGSGNNPLGDLFGDWSPPKKP